MVRIRVVHASKLLAILAAAVLAVALAILIFSSTGSACAAADSGKGAAVSAAIFLFQPPPMEFELPGEDDHTDRAIWTAPESLAGEEPPERSARPRVLPVELKMSIASAMARTAAAKIASSFDA